MSKSCLALHLPEFGRPLNRARRPLRRRHFDLGYERHRLTGPASFPAGAWPRRLCAAYAAAYCGELTVEAFLKRVGIDYPLPRVNERRRRLWLRRDRDKAILPSELVQITDIA